MAILHSTLGAIIIGVLIATLLFGMFCLQCFAFIANFKNENKLLGYSVVTLWVLETVHTALMWHMVYCYFVIHFADRRVPFGMPIPWSASALLCVTICIVVLVDGWYSYRVWILSGRNRLITYPVLGFICSFVGVGAAAIVQLLVKPSWATVHAHEGIFVSALALSTAVDIYITTSLLLLLYRSRKEITPRGLSMLNRILIYIVGAGVLTSLLAISEIIVVLTAPHTLTYYAIFCVFGEAYGNSLLAWLNAREHLRPKSDLPHLPTISVRVTRRTKPRANMTASPNSMLSTRESFPEALPDGEKPDVRSSHSAPC